MGFETNKKEFETYKQIHESFEAYFDIGFEIGIQGFETYT